MTKKGPLFFKFKMRQSKIDYGSHRGSRTSPDSRKAHLRLIYGLPQCTFEKVDVDVSMLFNSVAFPGRSFMKTGHQAPTNIAPVFQDRFTVSTSATLIRLNLGDTTSNNCCSLVC